MQTCTNMLHLDNYRTEECLEWSNKTLTKTLETVFYRTIFSFENLRIFKQGMINDRKWHLQSEEMGERVCCELFRTRGGVLQMRDVLTFFTDLLWCVRTDGEGGEES